MTRVSHSFGQYKANPPSIRPGQQSECPWLTAGSASHALQGEVRVTVSLKDKSQGACAFSTLKNPRNELSISVGGNELHACPRASPAIAGVGTYAYLCSLNPSTHDLQRMISGGVREKHFVVMMKKSSAPDGVTFSSDLAGMAGVDEQLKRVAELVAGNLF